MLAREIKLLPLSNFGRHSAGYLLLLNVSLDPNLSSSQSAIRIMCLDDAVQEKLKVNVLETKAVHLY